MITMKGVDPRMIANNLTPFEATHPGEVLKEEIEYRGISQRKLAAQIGMSYSVLNEVLNSKRPVTTEYAMLFEAALGISAKLLVNMQTDYNIQVAKQNSSFMDKLNNIRKIAAIL
ncbi:MAG: HigA family addiction module antitoxin [Bacteroides sp.]|nr:HigA family addiction module antitoxin [Bacteroides sp.]